MPDDLTELKGPTSGKLRLPGSVYSSGAGPAHVFDLDDEEQRIRVYQIVLTNGSADDIRKLLNANELIRFGQGSGYHHMSSELGATKSLSVRALNIMSLDAMQQEIIRIFTELPEARRFALAGGGAMLAHGFIDRITRDLDFAVPISHDRENSYPDRCQKVFAITRKTQTPTKRVTLRTELPDLSCVALARLS